MYRDKEGMQIETQNLQSRIFIAIVAFEESQTQQQLCHNSFNIPLLHSSFPQDPKLLQNLL
jgi:hypothetical protein